MPVQFLPLNPSDWTGSIGWAGLRKGGRAASPDIEARKSLEPLDGFSLFEVLWNRLNL